MNSIAVCPTSERLNQIISDQASEAEVEALVGHLETCPNCLQRVRTLNDSTITDDLRAAGTLPDSAKSPPIQELMRKLIDLDPSMDKTGTVNPLSSFASQTISQPEPQAQADAAELSFLAAPQTPNEIGRLNGYRVLKILGAGGMGLVLEAEDIRLKRRVALKVMKPEVARKELNRQRFIREAESAAKVEHDHIVPIFQVGEENGVPFIAMPFLKGEPLDTRLKRGRLEMSEIIQIGRQIAEGLAAAHAHGLIHRDIKPGNVWLEEVRTSEGGKQQAFRVRILDFGLARLSTDSENLTQSGTILGTPAYMAPEQARGRAVDFRVDLWSLGCILYEISTGVRPFSGKDTMAILSSLALDEPADPLSLNPNIPVPLAQLIVKLLAKDRAKRPSSGDEVAKALRKLQPDGTVVIVAAPLIEQLSPWADIDADATIVNPTPEPAIPIAEPKSTKARSSTKWIVAASFLLLLLGGGFAAFQLIFKTKDGTLVVEVEDDASVKFQKGELQILDNEGKLRYTLKPSEHNKDMPPGTYRIRVVGADGLTVDTDEFTMKNGDKVSVRVKMLPKALAKLDPPTKAEPKVVGTETIPSAKDRDKPFALMREGKQVSAFAQFAEAISAHKNGDAIEIYGNGPFQVGPVMLSGQNLTVRAASGFRPRLVPSNDVGDRWFSLGNVQLVMEGVELVGITKGKSWFWGSGLSWEFRNCRLQQESTNANLIVYTGPRLRLADCLLVSSTTIIPDYSTAKTEIELVNNFICSGFGGAPAIAQYPRGQKIRLSRNTVVGMLLHVYAPGEGFMPLEVEAEHNLILDHAIATQTPPPECIHWHGKENRYAAVYPAKYKGSPPGNQKVQWDAWKKMWGTDDVGSDIVEPIPVRWTNLRSDDPAILRKNLQEFTAEMHRQHGDCGADLDRIFRVGGVPPIQVPTRDGAKPFTLVHKGAVVSAFPTLAAALIALPNDHEIIVRGNGPFLMPRLKVENRTLVLKSAPGFRPVFLPDPTAFEDRNDNCWIRLKNAGLTIEGCDFLVRGTPAGHRHLHLLEGSDRPCAMHNCRLIGFSELFRGLICPAVTLEDCLLLADRLGDLPGGCELNLTNNLICCLTLLGEIRRPGGQKLHLTRNAIVTTWTGLIVKVEEKANGVTVEAEGNLFSNSGAGWPIYTGGFKDRLRWQGKNNWYVGMTKGLASWNAELAEPEVNSHELPSLPFGWLVDMPGEAAKAVPWWQARLAEIRKQSGLADLGPDLSLVGPGDAYVRGLAAEGKAVPKELLRVEPLTSGPIVLIRNGKPFRGFTELQKAFDAIQDGDGIEVRSDATIKGGSLAKDRGEVTLRAGPGYRPTLESSIGVPSGTALAVEGMVFSFNAGISTIWTNDLPLEKQGCITRLAYCAFDPNNSSISALFLGKAGSPGEILRCVVSRTIQSFADKDTSVRIRECIVQEVSTRAQDKRWPEKQLLSSKIELEGCILTRMGVHGERYLIHEWERPYHWVARRCLFESNNGLLRTNWKRVWDGAKNCYSISFNWVNDGGSGIFSLAQWRAFVNSPETGSVEGEPLIADPQRWKLRPGSPAFGLGPDVDRIARTVSSVDPDRRAAEYVLSIGGLVAVSGKSGILKSAAELPHEAFRLTEVNLQGNMKLNDAGLAVFKDCKNLTYLNLSGTKISDASLVHFKDCKNLTDLMLNHTPITATGLASFKDCRNLRRLDLGSTSASDTGLANFAESKDLTSLNLNNTKVSGAGLAHFKDCKNLTELWVKGTKVSDAGLVHFKDWRNLARLDLGGTSVSDAGLALFRDCKDLTYLNLNDTKVSGASLAQFKDCKNLTELWVKGTQVSDAGLVPFKDWKNLARLDLGGTSVSDAGLALFRDCKNLVGLDLHGTQLTDAGAAHFKDCKNLEWLNLADTKVTDASLVPFEDCKNLNHVDLTGTSVGDAALIHFKECKNLIDLRLHKTKVTGAAIDQFKKTLPKCRIGWDGGTVEPK